MYEEAILQLEADLAKYGKVAIRNVPCCAALFGCEQTGILFVRSTSGISIYMDSKPVRGDDAVQFALVPVENSPWSRLRLGPFDALPDALRAASKFLETADLREPICRQAAWNQWGLMWLSCLSHLKAEKGSFELQSNRKGEAIVMTLRIGGSEFDVLSLFDQTVGWASTEDGEVMIRAIGSDRDLFLWSLKGQLEGLLPT